MYVCKMAIVTMVLLEAQHAWKPCCACKHLVLLARQHRCKALHDTAVFPGDALLGNTCTTPHTVHALA